MELVTPPAGGQDGPHPPGQQNAVEEVGPTTREERQNKLLEALGRMLGLDGAPGGWSPTISNQGADDIVASMVVYVDGKALKRDYRRFKLKDMDGPDDYASMEQVLTGASAVSGRGRKICRTSLTCCSSTAASGACQGGRAGAGGLGLRIPASAW